MIDDRTPAQRRAIAFHEGGHAAAAHVLGFPIERLPITFGKENAGYFAGGISTDMWAPLRGSDARVRQLASEQLIKGHVVMVYAGPAAQRIHAPRSQIPRCAVRDCEQASQWAALICYTEAHPAFLRWADREARALVKLHWHLVEAVADALLEREEHDWRRSRRRHTSRGGASVANCCVRCRQSPKKSLTSSQRRKRARAIGRREIADALLRAYAAGSEDLQDAVVADLAARRECDADEVAAKVRTLCARPLAIVGPQTALILPRLT